MFVRLAADVPWERQTPVVASTKIAVYTCPSNAGDNPTDDVDKALASVCPFLRKALLDIVLHRNLRAKISMLLEIHSICMSGPILPTWIDLQIRRFESIAQSSLEFFDASCTGTTCSEFPDRH